MANNMRVFDYSTPRVVEDELRKIVKLSTGRTYVQSCRLSHLPEDVNHFLVVGKSTYGYSVWHYDCVKKSLYWGHYDLPYYAIADYIANKLNGRE